MPGQSQAVRARHRLPVIGRRELISVTTAGRGSAARPEPVRVVRDPARVQPATVVEARILLAHRRWL